MITDGPLPTFETIAETTGDRLTDLVDALGAAAAAGSEPALESLLFAIDHHRLADAGIQRILMDDQAVDDVRQDVLIAVTESMRSWAGRGHLTSWLFTVGRNKAVAYLRRQNPTPDGQVDDMVADSERISSLIASALDADELVGQLPELYRDAVRLRDLEGRSYAQVADALGLPLNTTRSRICRGRAILAHRLTES